jgi:hypothetical protein
MIIFFSILGIFSSYYLYFKLTIFMYNNIKLFINIYLKSLINVKKQNKIIFTIIIIGSFFHKIKIKLGYLNIIIRLSSFNFGLFDTRINYKF